VNGALIVNADVSKAAPSRSSIRPSYDSEINVHISWLWDGGIDIKLGDDMTLQSRRWQQMAADGRISKKSRRIAKKSRSNKYDSYRV
jgi:hypothetical protein